MKKTLAIALGMGVVGGSATVAYLRKKAIEKLDGELSDLINGLFVNNEEGAAEIFSDKVNKLLDNNFKISVESIDQCKEVVKILTLRGKVQLRDLLSAEQKEKEAGKDFEPAE